MDETTAEMIMMDFLEAAENDDMQAWLAHARMADVHEDGRYIGQRSVVNPDILLTTRYSKPRLEIRLDNDRVLSEWVRSEASARNIIQGLVYHRVRMCRHLGFEKALGDLGERSRIPGHTPLEDESFSEMLGEAWAQCVRENGTPARLNAYMSNRLVDFVHSKTEDAPDWLVHAALRGADESLKMVFNSLVSKYNDMYCAKNDYTPIPMKEGAGTDETL